MYVDAAIIGAGIVGTSCAFFLTRAGLKVALIERGGIAGGTSGSGEGNILVSDKVPGPELELARAGRALWQTLAQELSADFEFEPKGGIVVAENDSQYRALQAHNLAMREVGIETRILSTAELYELEPLLARDVAGAAYFPQDAQVQPMLAVAALVKHAQQDGAILFDHTRVLAIERNKQGAICGLRTEQGSLTTPMIINAAGPWSAQVAALAGLDVPIQPRKGHIVVTEPLPLLVRHKVYEATYFDTVNSGEADLQIASVVEGTKSGTILLGSSRQLVGFDPTVEARVIRAIIQKAVRYFPVLASAHALRAYVGFRPFSPDHLPLIGEVTQAPGFYLNTGHEGAGIGLGPISGKLLSQLILGQTPDLDLTPFQPMRFKDGTVTHSL
ncbi:FAD-binding oxidoreductase [Ktedonosporobacter rubrisoli]|uniref:FAD-binding oxidoreductase n=1 Tax=Ktedonosporobacter rubrisoli TaxID=2509675 RepID=A0A4P6K4S6_KTERU|nr:FAD-binding oxidoreductase [Ktedonosporobacter rubrisoli]QBD82526.1 FAD-binding oxidoreductase [Ktedonosporobacter rubrisoli]